eukprot:UN3322
MPLLILTDPDNPLGNMKHLQRAVGFWAFTVLGLLGFIVDILVNEVLTRKGNDVLGPYQKVLLEEEETRNSAGSAERRGSDQSVSFALEQ